MDIKPYLFTSHKYLTTLVGHILLVATLSACGGNNGSDGGTTNSAPVATDTGFSVLPGDTYGGTLPASDADGDSLNYASVTGPGNGTLTITDPATGAFSYTLNGAASGDTFTFLANDGELDSNIATVTITGTIPAAPSSGLQTTVHSY